MSLTKEDLEAALTGLKEELRADMRGMNNELRADMRGMNTELRNELHADVREMNNELRNELHADMRVIEGKVDIVLETARQIETNLLTEFHRYAKGQQVRLHSLEMGESNLKLHLATIEERLLALEFKPREGSPPPTVPPQ